jgi:hypothetical protein
MSELEPDIDGLSRFINALFTYAREEEFVSLRAFYDDERAKKIGEPAYKIRNVRLNGGGLEPQAAQQPIERLLVGVVLLPAGEVADVASAAGERPAVPEARGAAGGPGLRLASRIGGPEPRPPPASADPAGAHRVQLRPGDGRRRQPRVPLVPVAVLHQAGHLGA